MAAKNGTALLPQTIFLPTPRNPKLAKAYSASFSNLLIQLPLFEPAAFQILERCLHAPLSFGQKYSGKIVRLESLCQDLGTIIKTSRKTSVFDCEIHST